jgi:hypothetical protein
MTDKVDVLAVLDFEIAEQRSEHGIADSRLLRARAAVAELIAAAIHAEAHIAMLISDGLLEEQQDHDLLTDLRAALARVQP